MAKRIPGPHNDKVLPIQKADQEIKSSFQDVLNHLKMLAQRINPYAILGFKVLELLESENLNLEAELRRAADALAKWREVTQGMTEDAYYELNHANEEARRQSMKERRSKKGDSL
jgi:hypothetical protein